MCNATAASTTRLCCRYLWSVEQKRNRLTQEVLLNAYARRKRRMLLYSCFKSWAHKAIYGKIEGLHSRAELVQSLEDQKRHTAALEAALKSSRETLKQAEEALASEGGARNERQKQLLEKEEASVGLRFALDNAEAELVRLQTILDNVARMHPHTVRKMMKMDPAKGFIDR